MRGRLPRLSSQSRHVDGSEALQHSYGSHDWAWCCEHAGSDDFRRAISLLQAHLPVSVSHGTCCALGPAEVFISSSCSSKGRADLASVRVWLGASGASLFRLQVQSVTGVAMASDSAEEPLFELRMPSGAVVHLRGMVNYGVASYCAALGQLLTPPAPAPAARGSRPHAHSRPHPTRSGGGGGGGGGGARGGLRAKGPLSALSTTAARAGGDGAHLAQILCSVPSREGNWSGGGRRGAAAAKAVAAAAAAAAAGVRGHMDDWLLWSASTPDGSGGSATAAAAGAALYGGVDGEDDDLKADGGGGDLGGCSSSSGGSGAPVAEPVVRVTAWVRVGFTGSEVPLPYDEIRTSTSIAAVATAAAAAMGLNNGEASPIEPRRGRQVAAAVGHEGDDDVANDVCGGGSGGGGGSRNMINMRWAPDAAPRRNAHLLNLLGLPTAGCSYRIPVPEPDLEAADPGGALPFDDEEECVSVLGLLEGEEAEAAEPRWVPGGPGGCELLPPRGAPPSEGLAAAADAAAGLIQIGSCPVAASGAGSYSLEGSGLGVGGAAATVTAAAPRGRGLLMEAQRLLQQQQQQQLQRQRQQQPQRQQQEQLGGRMHLPAAVEVMNLLSVVWPVAEAAEALAPPAAAGCTDFAVSYINSVEWVGDDDLGVDAGDATAAYLRGGSGGGDGSGGGGGRHTCSDSFCSLFGIEDDVIKLDELPYSNRDAANAAVTDADACCGAASGVHGCRRHAGGVDAGSGGGASPPNLPRWLSPEGCGAQPPLPPPVLLTSLTTGAVWL